MAQKVLRVGTSAAVTIPKEIMSNLGLKPGDSVNVQVDKRRRTVVIEPVVQAGPDRELLEWTQGFVKRYRPALAALAKK
ncbi:MAG: AbrB/MazE/SpoVT family DNA-binding domain-containing protein [Candidatus Veblenbacteria bacterium]|nr:AbrB/MazE/SpoVT family DNA-binding domain-containing protein [Candidatus Veblenbacteria bacterium]